MSGLLAVLVDELDERLRIIASANGSRTWTNSRARGYLGHDPPSFCDPSADTDRSMPAIRDMQPSTAERMLTSRCAHPISWSGRRMVGAASLRRRSRWPPPDDLGMTTRDAV